MTYTEKKVERRFKEISLQEQCCTARNIVLDRGFYVCSNCGTIHFREIENDFIGYPSSLRNEQKQSERKYSPFGPRTLIRGMKDGKGHYLKPRNKSQYERLAKINRGLINALERNLWQALPKFKMISKKLDVPKHIEEDAYRIYMETAKQRMALGRSIDGLITAAFYCALRIHKIPRSIDEIIETSQISKKSLMRCFKIISSEILPILNLQIHYLSPESFIDKYRKKLDLDIKCTNMAIEIIKKAKDKGLSVFGKDPRGFAAASLYLCTKFVEEFEEKTQKEICKIARISEVTLRMRIKELKSHL